MYVTTMTAMFLWIANQAASPLGDATRKVGAKTVHDGRMIVLLDPGHGGSEMGACSRVTRRCEKDLTLALSLQMKARLEDRGLVRVVMTRMTDRHVPLYRRSDLARAGRADLFVSIHTNASASHVERGFETYVYPDLPRTIDAIAALPPNPDSQAFARWNINRVTADLQRQGQRSCSAHFGRLVEASLRRALGSRMDRGLKEKALAVLAGLDVPGVLVEVGFADHRIEGRRLMEPGYRRRIVEALAQAIETWAQLGRRAGCLRQDMTPTGPAPSKPDASQVQDELPNLPELPRHMTDKERAGLLSWRT